MPDAIITQMESISNEIIKNEKMIKNIAKQYGLYASNLSYEDENKINIEKLEEEMDNLMHDKKELELELVNKNKSFIHSKPKYPRFKSWEMSSSLLENINKAIENIQEQQVTVFEKTNNALKNPEYNKRGNIMR